MYYLCYMSTYLKHAVRYARAHTVVSAIATIIVLGGGYIAYSKIFAPSEPVKYVLGTVTKEDIASTVTGSGQVSASNQVDIKPKASGEIVSIVVAEGQTVSADAAIAYIDSTDAQKAVRDAKTALDSAKLALAKLQKPADTLSITQAQNAIAKARETEQNAKDDQASAYDDGFTDVANTFTDIPAVMTGLKNVVFGFEAGLGGTSQWNIDFYGGKINSFHNDSSGTALSTDIKSKYESAKSAYDKAFAAYKATSRQSDTSAVETTIQQTSDAVTALSEALKAMHNIIRVYEDTLDSNVSPPAAVSAHLASINTYTATTNTRLSALRAALQTIKDSRQAILDAGRSIAEGEAQLQKLRDGTDTLDLQSAELTVQQRQNTLMDAQNALSDYSIRTPFAGTIAKLDIHKGDTVSPATLAAIIVTKQQLAELSLNEVDAAKVQVGEKTTLTFDAIDELSISGDVASIDTIGTVSQGVVTYTVKVGFDAQDSRVKTGMTVNASIVTAEKSEVLVVPSSAVKKQGSESYVLVVDTAPQERAPGGVELDKAPVRTVVETGISNDTETEIISGLREGQVVVIRTITSGTEAAASQGGIFAGPQQRGGTSGNVRVRVQ